MTGIKTTQAPSVAGKKGFSLISDEKFRQLYAALLQCKMLDERLQAAPDHNTPHYEAWMGREASAAAIVSCLRPGDSITPTPRAVLASYLHSNSLPPACSPSTPQAQLAAANDDALRHKLRKRGNVTVVFACAAQPASIGNFFAAATKQSLPVLYVLEGGTPSAELCQGIPVIHVDASDAVAIYRVACESITRARDEVGPTILECTPWPGGSHSTDPLLKLERYLAGRRLFRPQWRLQLEQKYAGSIDKAVRSILN
ncbi:MAG: thiamine pyrophosphate-dependent enzyme [Acidobacteriaceae bacterium]